MSGLADRITKFAARMRVDIGETLCDDLRAFHEDVEEMQDEIQEMIDHLESWLDTDADRDTRSVAREEIDQLAYTVTEKMTALTAKMQAPS